MNSTRGVLLPPSEARLSDEGGYGLGLGLGLEGPARRVAVRKALYPGRETS